MSPLGEYQLPLQHLLALTAIRPIARTYVKLPAWLPRVANGRAFQVCIPNISGLAVVS